MGRWSVLLGIVATTIVGVAVACSAPKANANGDGTAPPPSSLQCATPQMGCPCTTPGAEVACGKKVNGDLNFIYCYEGKRVCESTGVYGDCLDGTVVPQSLSSVHTLGLGTPGPCSSIANPSDPLKVCTDGQHKGDFCLSDVDCASGEKLCVLGSDDGNTCKNDNDCADPGFCDSFDGTCAGGPRAGKGCHALLAIIDCGLGNACTPGGAVGTCNVFVGICDNGMNDGDACNSDVDCAGGGTCEPGHGRCFGGKNNNGKCKHNKHCPNGGVCSADPDAGAPAIDPCDPYCNVVSDTPTGFDAGPGFVIANDGGLTVLGCGDGVLNGAEQCDDGNTMSGDGCSGSCTLEPGFQCPTPGSPCIPSTCGNGILEGTEQCDDGNLRPYDGCSITCTKEVSCPSAGPCVAVCGDGIKFPTEACDDGNTKPGDGCSPTCTVEMGATCTTVTAPLPPSIDVPVIYRDFQECGQGLPASTVCGNGAVTAPEHPDFEMPGVPHGFPAGQPCTTGGAHQGIPAIALGVDKEPTFNTQQPCVGNATTFQSWYHDDPVYNQVILGRFIRLFQQGGPMSSTYQFDSSNDTVTADKINCGYGTNVHCGSSGPGGLNGFWPINGLGFGNYAALNKNFGFTSEVRVPFTFAGGESLQFTGDDDVFVYVGGSKVVDIGGIHGPINGNVTLSTSTNVVPGPGTVALVVGNTYEIDVFQAERNTTGSNYKLTLQGFNRTTSSCSVPPPPETVIRDFEAVCPPGTAVVWQLFRWQASVPNPPAGQTIDFAAATAATQAALPAAATPSPPAVTIGQATPGNSPAAGPLAWTSDPLPVADHLKAANITSQTWLRVFMTFNGTPTLYQWQQLYDCIPNE